MTIRRALVLAVAAVVLASCAAKDNAAPRPTTTTRSARVVVTRGERLGWHTMAYLASNRPSVPIQIFSKAPASVTVGTSTAVNVSTFPVGEPVWSSITPARFSVTARGGEGRIEVRTEGCPAHGPCDPRPLYTANATPIAALPPGGVVAKFGFAFKLDTTAIEPGRYDVTVPIRYASNDKFASVLNTRDTLHVRIDVAAQPPPSSICTPADLGAPTGVIAPPHALVDTISVEHGNTRLDPPPRGIRPRVSPARARKLLLGMRAGRGGGVGTIVLASVSEILPRSLHPDGTLTPDVHNVLEWVLYTQRVAVTPPAPPPGAAFREVTTRPPPPCIFLDGLSAISATTGAQLDSAGFTGAAVPLQF